MTSSKRLRAFGGALAAACVCGAALVAAAATPSADDDLARRTLANADQLMREGKIEQALREFEQVSTAYADSSLADDALYRLASYYYPAESPAEAGGATPTAMGKARELLEKITTKYPREELAPRALLKLGLMALDPANPRRNLDEAYASFSGAVNIYPGSDVVDRALFGAGYADFLAGKYDKSIVSFERVAEGHPKHAIAEDARYTMALAYVRLGSWVRALEELQACRDRFPEGKLSSRALDLATRVYKLKVLPGISSRPPLAHDPTFAPAVEAETLRGEVLLAVDPDNVIHLVNSPTGAVRRLDPSGKLASTAPPLGGAVSISVGADGIEVLAAGDGVRSGVEVVHPARVEGGESVPLEDVSAAVALGPFRMALLDSSSNEILVMTGNGRELKTLYRDPEEKVRLTGLAAGAEGRLYTIDRRGRRVLEIAPDGRSRAVGGTTAGEPIFQEPSALAADDLGDIFVLDRRARSVTILSSDGKVVQTIASQAGTPAEFSYPTSIAVGPRGEIYIHDEKRRTILRFR